MSWVHFKQNIEALEQKIPRLLVFNPYLVLPFPCVYAMIWDGVDFKSFWGWKSSFHFFTLIKSFRRSERTNKHNLFIMYLLNAFI